MRERLKYDVFLSHNSADKPAVLQIALELKKVHIEPFLDIWNLQRGTSFQPGLSDALDGSGCCAVFVGPTSDGPWQNEELRYALNRAARTRDDYRVIPVLLPGCDPQRMDGFLSLRTWVDFRPGLDDQAALDQLIAAINGEAPPTNMGLPELLADPRPYRGILPFDDAHSEFYFGRNPEIERLATRLQQERMVAVLGASGSGKSSLVRSGLYTKCAEEISHGIRGWQRIAFAPGSSPLLRLAAGLVGQLPSENRPGLIATFQAGFSSGPDGLITAVETLFPQQQLPVLLIVDQFEELFTQRPVTKVELEAWRSQTASFAANLRAAVERGPVWLKVIVTLRADFLDRFISDDFPDLRQMLETRQFWVAPMTIDDFREAVVLPARERGAYFEKGLVERILRDMQGETTALPLLEEALDNLWDRRRGYWLTNEAYDAIGGVGGALAGKADRILALLSPPQKALARRLFTKLVQLGEGSRDTRRRISYAEARAVGDDPKDFDEVLSRFSAARLVSLSRSLQDQGVIQVATNTVEVSHDALIDHWGTLRSWLNDGRQDIRLDRRLAEGAQRWDEERKKTRGKSGGLLWRSPELDLALSYVDRQQGAVSLLQTEFVQASSRKERLRRLWIRVAWIGTPLALFGAASIYLIAISPADVWERISQPDVAEAVDDRVLPVHAVAINRAAPSFVLYLARNAAWTRRPFTFVPSTKTPDFIPAVEAMLKSDKLVTPVARVTFEVLRNDKVVGSGDLVVTAGLGAEGKPRFLRTLNYQGEIADETGKKTKGAKAAKTTNKTASLSVQPTLLPEDEDVFDLGDYAEALGKSGLFQNDDSIKAKITDLVTKHDIQVEYDLGDAFEWGSSRKQLWGPEFKIFGSRSLVGVKIGGAVLTEHKNEVQFWTQIARSDDWQVYREPKWSEVSAGGLGAKAAEIQKTLANRGDATSLEKALGTFDWTGKGGREYLEAKLLSTEAPSGESELVRLEWSETPQGSGPMTPVGTEWLLQMGGSKEWKAVTFQFLKDDDIRGVWSLERDGRSALLLSAHQGFYRTRDGGSSWKAANYGETGFTSGTKVKSIVVNDSSSIFALIDRGAAEDDGENPLFKLQHRNWLQRWSVGLTELFR
jgi:hypothetical protein